MVMQRLDKMTSPLVNARRVVVPDHISTARIYAAAAYLLPYTHDETRRRTCRRELIGILRVNARKFASFTR